MDYLQYFIIEFQKTPEGEVLNLIINGLPSILVLSDILLNYGDQVLNLIINGLPSIQLIWDYLKASMRMF